MMKDKKESKPVFHQRWLRELLIGMVLLVVVFIVAMRADLNTTSRRLNETVSYVKEQCSTYDKINLASETKSLMRMIQSAGLVDDYLKDALKENDEQQIDEELLKKCVKANYVTGVIITDKLGQIWQQYGMEPQARDVLKEILESDAVRDIIDHPEKQYTARIACEDDSYLDLAVTSRADGRGLLAVYYHTPAEYVRTFNHSLELLLSGYNINSECEIVVSKEGHVVASNRDTLIGKSTDDIPILQRIRGNTNGGQLVYARNASGHPVYEFGLMQRSREYYIYAYMSERNAFATLPINLLYSMAIYIFGLIIIHTIRWRMNQNYQRDQLRRQQEYTESLQQKNEQLVVAVEQADRANAAKTSFLSRMSHDIRTPLNGIIGLLRIDETHPDDLEMISANRKKIQVAADYLLSLINDILQMSKLESGEVTLAHEPIDMIELTKEVVTIIELRAAEAGVTLEYENVPEELIYRYVYGSPLHIRQIFLNIYSNCVKYNKVGGKIRTEVSRVSVENNIVTYRWIISDTGIGMSKEFLQQIFKPFAQEHVDARSEYTGTGLGMSIVKSLVDKMGGTIKVSSEEGVGSRFILTLPLEIADESAIETVSCKQQEHEIKQASIRGLHLLLAEDNELNAEIAQTLLTDEGATVTLVGDGQQALQAFADQPQGTYDAILLDIMMPVMDGLSAARAIRRLERPDAATIPILAMTANAFAEDARRCMEAGMNVHLSKPLQMDRVIAEIARCCDVQE